jgi:hypothetical protein
MGEESTPVLEQQPHESEQIETEEDSRKRLSALGYDGSLKHYQQRHEYGGADGIVEGMVDGFWVKVRFGRRPTGQGVQTDAYVAAVDTKFHEARIGHRAYDEAVAKELWHRLHGLSYPDSERVHANQTIHEEFVNIPGNDDKSASDELCDKLLADDRLVAKRQ